MPSPHGAQTPAPARVNVTDVDPKRHTTARPSRSCPSRSHPAAPDHDPVGDRPGLGALVLSWWGNHNAVWVLMTLIALIPPSIPLTIDRVLQRLAGTVLAMVFLTVVDVMIPIGSGRLVVIAVGLVVTIAYVRRSYALSVLGISCVAVLVYAGVTVPLGEALLWRGLDTVVGAVIAIVMTLLIPVGPKPQPVWAHDSAAVPEPTASGPGDGWRGRRAPRRVILPVTRRAGP